MQKCCVITLRSVFVQGIRALETLSPNIYYELLIIMYVHAYKDEEEHIYRCMYVCYVIIILSITCRT